MKWSTALLLTALLTAGIGAEEKPNKSKFAWRDFSAAMKEAPETNKIIFVEVYTDW